MPAHSIDQFLSQSADRQLDHGEFELERERILQVNLNGRVWMKMGAMIAYRGNIRFEREGLLDKGVGQLLKKAVTGEGARLSKAEGQGSLYLADGGKKITLLDLAGGTLFVNGNDLLAFQDGIDHEVKMTRKLSAIAAGGLFNVRVSGQGILAITTHYDPLALAVEPGRPVFTDPNATVCWSGNLTPDFKTDMQLKTLFGRGSGESFQMKFESTGQPGFVVVQPSEEVAFQHAAG